MSDTPVLTKPKPIRRRRRIDGAMRRRIEAAIEAMINALDAIEDPDEDSQADDGPIDDDELEGPEYPDDEPSLGASEHFNQGLAWRVSEVQMLCPDGEPSLGSIEGRGPDFFASYDHVSHVLTSHGLDQRTWAAGGNDDREDEHDGREPDVDDEPSLGSVEAEVDQTGWASGDQHDREHDEAEHEGAVDDDPCDTNELEACAAHDDEMPRKTVAASIDDQAAARVASKALRAIVRRRKTTNSGA